MRGLVMVIMALDHTRDLIHIDSLTTDPLNFSTTSFGLFATRWITHLCAPTFVFLSGISAWLSFQRSENPSNAKRFLLTRGLWLLLLEITVVNFGIWFNIRFEILMLQVIAAIGFSMVVLSFLLSLSPRIIGTIGLIIIFGHNLLASVNFAQGTFLHYFWGTLFKLSVFQLSPRFILFVNYPLIPWLGIMCAGYGFAPYFAEPLVHRKRILLYTGIGAVSLFVLLRSVNVYGDPAFWSVQKTGLFTFLSFVNVSKYPPSLLFVLLTLGISLVITSMAEGKNNRLTRFFAVYGKVPLFYYIIHWYFIHGFLLVLLFIQGFRWEEFNFAPFRFGRPSQGGGVSLAGVYLTWLFVVLALYPLCRWYGRYKANHRNNRWLRYI